MDDRNRDLIAHRLDRANEALEDARVLSGAQRWNACVNRLYYACFYAVSGLLLLDGLASSKHSGIRSHFNRQYIKTGTISREMAQIYHKFTMICLNGGRKEITSTLSDLMNPRLCHGYPKQNN